MRKRRDRSVSLAMYNFASQGHTKRGDDRRGAQAGKVVYGTEAQRPVSKATNGRTVKARAREIESATRAKVTAQGKKQEGPRKKNKRRCGVIAMGCKCSVPEMVVRNGSMLGRE